MIQTTEDYWDCECEHHFIHSASVPQCKICGAERDSQPDSRVEEVGYPRAMAEEDTDEP